MTLEARAQRIPELCCTICNDALEQRLRLACIDLR